MKHNLFIIRYRLWFIITPIIATLLMLIPLRKARINPDLMEYLPSDIRAKTDLDRLEKYFGKNDPVILVFETDDVLNSSMLDRVGNLDKSFRESGKFRNITSVYEMKYIRNEGGDMRIDPVIREIPVNYKDKEKLRSEIRQNQLVYGLLVSKDFRHTIMVLNPENGVNDKEINRLIHQNLKKYPGKEKVFTSGMPCFRYEIQKTATRDLALLMPLGLIIILFALYLSFHERKCVVLPFSVVVMSIIVSMGLMPLLGYDLSLIAVLVPIMMIAIANNYGVHLMTRYQELNAIYPRWGMKRIMNEAVRKLSTPILLTALTTIVGVLGMVTHIMLPAKQMGVVSAAGILFALLVSLSFIPAMMTGFKRGKPSKSFAEKPYENTDHLLHWAGKVSTQKPVYVILGFSLIVLLAGVGISRLQVNVNMEEMMPASNVLRKSSKILNQSFGGTKMVSVLFEGDIKSPEVMKSMDDFGKKVTNLYAVSSATSVATVIRTMSKSLNNPGSKYYDRIPDKRDAIAQYIELYNMSGDPSDFEQMVDFDYTMAVVSVQFKANDYKSFDKTEKEIVNLVGKTPYSKLVAGQCLVEKELSEAIVTGQIWSLLFAFGSIIVLLWMMFSSFYAGLMGSIPLFVSLICNFGIMGWLGIKLDIATSLLSSVAIGIGVDYTIHLFWRLNFEMNHGKDWGDAIYSTLRTTGRGISLNAISVMAGFAVLFLSGLTILKAFGFLIIFSLLVCLFCALVLIPAIVMLSHSRFLMKSNKSQL